MNRKLPVAETDCRSSSEGLLRLGRLARILLRYGADISDIARELRVGRRTCALAIRFVAAPDRLKLRALVEEWTLLAVRRELRATRQPLFCG